MKRYRFLVLALLLIPGFYGIAQVPMSIPYRAMVQLNGGTLANQIIDARFTILGPGASTIAYQETQSLTTDSYGLLYASIGNGGTITGSMTNIDWSQGQYLLKVELSNGGNWINFGTSTLESVPFALHAQTVAEDSTNSYDMAYNGGQLFLFENGMPKDSVAISGTPFTTGAGISFAGGVLTNTGDLDPNNEMQFLTVDPINYTLSIAPGGNSVNLPQLIAGPGIQIVGGIVSCVADLNPNDDITIGSTAGGDLNGTYPNPTVDGLQGNPVSAIAPVDGQVLKWDGNTWKSASDSTNEFALKRNGNILSLLQLPDSNLVNSISLPGPQFTVGAGLSWSNNVLTNTGDIVDSDDITVGTLAGGDLAGTYPSPSVVALRGNPISSSAPQNGDVLVFTNGVWLPVQDQVNDADSDPVNELQQLSQVGNQLILSNGGGITTLFTAGTGISLSGNQISNSGDTDPSDDLTTSTTAGGDLSGTYPNPTVDAIQGRPVSTSAPASGEVLKWNGTEWEPGQDISNTYSAGSGISISGTTIVNTGDLNAADDILIGSIAGGDLGNTYPNPTVLGIQGVPISSSVPSNGQVLKLVNGQWAPSDDNDSYTPWTESGSDLSYTSGQVGIGTSSPVSSLSVGGNTTVVNSSGNIRVEAGVNGNDEGFLNVYDSNNQALVGMFINGSGQGDIFAGTKNFRVDHPDQADKDIWYASLEGPEAAAYVRGTATLLDGKVTVELPDHFRLIAANEGMTVMLTPLSAESKGLAVIQKDVTQFEVQELLKGEGNYSFDWEVKAVRLGYEEFEVIRPKMVQPQTSIKQ
ncbi:MAG: hypothetical protein AAF587_09410 [Bacteroidota bacterium]